jgi:hypothetical protein
MYFLQNRSCRPNDTTQIQLTFIVETLLICMWQDPPTTVFLLSIRTGAVGITLTAASHVYMVCDHLVQQSFWLWVYSPLLVLNHSHANLHFKIDNNVCWSCVQAARTQDSCQMIYILGRQVSSMCDTNYKDLTSVSLLTFFHCGSTLTVHGIYSQLEPCLNPAVRIFLILEA